MFWRKRFYAISAHPFTLFQDLLSQKTVFCRNYAFFRENFYFSQKIHYYHGNLKYLNNFHTSLGLQKENFDLLSHF